MNDAPHQRTKRQIFEEFMQEGVTALHFDPRQLAVRVPKHLRSQPWLVLNYSYRYRLEDLSIDDRGIGASLSFQGLPQHCWVPWSAVFAISDDQRSQWNLFTASAPPELRQQLSELHIDSDDSVQINRDESLPTKTEATALDSTPNKGASHLKLVK